MTLRADCNTEVSAAELLEGLVPTCLAPSSGEIPLFGPARPLGFVEDGLDEVEDDVAIFCLILFLAAFNPNCPVSLSLYDDELLELRPVFPRLLIFLDFLSFLSFWDFWDFRDFLDFDDLRELRDEPRERRERRELLDRLRLLRVGLRFTN